MDLVYPLKNNVTTLDLLFSLRSVCAHELPFDKVWCAGYTPLWLKDVYSIPVIQNKRSKWKNALYNVVAACQRPEVSDDFILMNDDFIQLNPCNPTKDLNVCGVSLQTRIARYAELSNPSIWQQGFAKINKLLQDLRCDHFMDFALHLPMIINKRKFLEVFNLPQVQDFIAENSYLPMRTLYGNMCWTNPVSISDVKIKQHEDMPLGWEKLQWISVYDNVIGNRKYPYLYGILYPLHVKHCRYEQFGRRDYER